MLYKGLNIGVFYQDKKWVEKWFDDFVNSIDHVCILRFVKNGLFPYRIDLKDGTRITAYRVDNDSARGTAIDKAFVDPTIDRETINNVIAPLKSHTNFIEVDY